MIIGWLANLLYLIIGGLFIAISFLPHQPSWWFFVSKEPIEKLLDKHIIPTNS